MKNQNHEYNFHFKNIFIKIILIKFLIYIRKFVIIITLLIYILIFLLIKKKH